MGNINQDVNSAALVALNVCSGWTAHRGNIIPVPEKSMSNIKKPNLYHSSRLALLPSKRAFQIERNFIQRNIATNPT